MSKKPFLLITNDDGIHAPGIRHLWEAVHEHADVAIVAPLNEKSGSGLSITWTKPLVLQQAHWGGATQAWSVNGTPADCVKMALSVLLDRKPNMVISGVNHGSNAGRTVLYSGTIGGVIEGALKGVPGIAFSFSDDDPPPLAVTKNYIYPIIQHFLDHPLPEGTILNVNFPWNAHERIAGVKIAKQGRGRWVECPEMRSHPQGMPYYWLGGKWASAEKEDETSDVHWIDQGYIAAVPIHVGELTDHRVIESHGSRFEARFSVNKTENSVAENRSIS